MPLQHSLECSHWYYSTQVALLVLILGMHQLELFYTLRHQILNMILCQYHQYMKTLFDLEMLNYIMVLETHITPSEDHFGSICVTFSGPNSSYERLHECVKIFAILMNSEEIKLSGGDNEQV